MSKENRTGTTNFLLGKFDTIYNSIENNNNVVDYNT